MGGVHGLLICLELQREQLTPPATLADLTDPQWAGKIASSYPNDDDAVLYLYTRYVNEFGWEWVAKLANQSVAFHRGSNVAAELVAAGEKLTGMGTDVGGNVVVPRLVSVDVGAHTRCHSRRLHFVRQSPVHKELGCSRVLGLGQNGSTLTPGDVLRAVTPEANMAGFSSFMEDRANVEEWKQTFSLYFGEVQGEPTPGFLGLYPGL